ncbi:MAG: hypothetical protein WAN33_10870 [Candidatus Acidiferrales bacterium]
MRRRIQAASLIVALLAVPLALVARGYACGPQECTMACCRGRHVMAKDCQHSASGAMSCATGCHSQATPDYGLAAPIAPFQLSAGVQLPGLKAARAISPVAAVSDFAGYSPPPFNPPRA